MIRRKDGYCRVCSKDGRHYVLGRGQHEAIKAAWMAGKAFYEGLGIYGEPITIKLAQVEVIADVSADVIAASEADEREDRRDAMLRGED